MPVKALFWKSVITCLRIRPAEAKKEVHIPLAAFCNETVGEVELPLGV